GGQFFLSSNVLRGRLCDTRPRQFDPTRGHVDRDERRAISAGGRFPAGQGRIPWRAPGGTPPHSRGPLTNTLRPRIITLAAQYRPRPCTEAASSWMRVGSWSTARMSSTSTVAPRPMSTRSSRAAKPSELPVERAEKVELVINLKAAKALGLTIPPSMLARGDEVIQKGIRGAAPPGSLAPSPL